MYDFSRDKDVPLHVNALPRTHVCEHLDNIIIDYYVHVFGTLLCTCAYGHLASILIRYYVRALVGSRRSIGTLRCALAFRL